MKVHLKFDKSDPKDTRFTVVIDDAPCGRLSMTTEDAVRVADIVKSGCSQYQCDFESSGKLYRSESFVVWHKVLWSGIKGVVRKEGADRIEGRAKIEEAVKTGEINGGLMEIKTVKIEKTDDLNMILGHSHFIKTVEDVYEAIVNTVPGAKFGLAFCEASGPCLVRYTGTDNDLIELAKKNAYNLSAGHSFIIFMKDMLCFP